MKIENINKNQTNKITKINKINQKIDYKEKMKL